MTTTITGIVLAGGKSSRMGSDKGLIKWKGQELILYSLQQLSQVTEEIIIISANKEYLKFNVPVVEDRVYGKGPLGGIQAAMLHSKHERLLITTCDNPAISSDILKGLISEHGENDVTILADGGFDLNPFPCMIQKNLKQHLNACIEANRLSMRNFFSNLKIKAIQSGKYDTNYRPVNMNKQQDLETL